VRKSTRARYTLEFKLDAVRLVKSGQSIAVTARILGIAEQTLHNWIKADKQGRLHGADSKPVSPEQMEIARLRAELGLGAGKAPPLHLSGALCSAYAELGSFGVAQLRDSLSVKVSGRRDGFHAPCDSL
jgi:transposase